MNSISTRSRVREYNRRIQAILIIIILVLGIFNFVLLRHRGLNRRPFIELFLLQCYTHYRWTEHSFFVNTVPRGEEFKSTVYDDTNTEQAAFRGIPLFAYVTTKQNELPNIQTDSKSMSIQYLINKAGRNISDTSVQISHKADNIKHIFRDIM